MLLLASALLLSVVAGFLLGGSLRRFEKVHLRWWILAPAGLALQLIPASGRVAGLALLFGSYVFLLAFTIRNARTAGFALLIAGLALNVLVIGANGGMPVTRHALAASGQEATLEELENEGGAKHHLADGELLLPLGDVIPVGGPFHQVMSIGDVLVYAGIAWFVIAAMRGKVTARRTASRSRSDAGA